MSISQQFQWDTKHFEKTKEEPGENLLKNHLIFSFIACKALKTVCTQASEKATA